MSKGSKRREASVSKERFDRNWMRIFHGVRPCDPLSGDGDGLRSEGEPSLKKPNSTRRGRADKG